MSNSVRRSFVVNPLSLPKEVKICEVAPRDGFQSFPEWIPTEKKIEIIRRLPETGIRSIEITSFVHPKVVPQLKDAEEVVKGTINELKEVDIRALVPNLRGAERAVDAGVKKLKTMLSATDSHSLSNANETVENAQKNLMPIFEFAARKNVEVMGSISVAFGCSFEGNVPIEQLIKIIKNYESMGVKEISLADTTGMAQPKQVHDTLHELKERFPKMTYSMHFHNTRGMALANIFASLQQGITHFDSSISGLGGCPYIPNATGNVATEDLVHMINEMGIETGIQLDELLDVAKFTANTLQTKGDSYLLSAGPSSNLYEKPTHQEKIDQS